MEFEIFNKSISGINLFIGKVDLIFKFKNNPFKI